MTESTRTDRLAYDAARRSADRRPWAALRRRHHLRGARHGARPPGRVGTALVVWQWVMFAIAAGFGLRHSVYGNLFRLVKRRFDLGAPPATEPEAGPRFAQACGLAVLSVALVALALGATTVAWVAVGVVLTLSLLLASTNVCIGCLLYGVIVPMPAPLGAARR
jgi:hypothetical protein